MWLPLFGVLSSVVFGCHELCLDMLTYLLVSSHLASQSVLQCVKWCLLAFFDVYERKKNNNRSFEDLEKIFKDILSSFYNTLYFWTAASPLMINYEDFLVCFSLSN